MLDVLALGFMFKVHTHVKTYFIEEKGSFKEDYDEIKEMPVANMGLGCRCVDSVSSTFF
jgi:hypothetical protein